MNRSVFASHRLGILLAALCASCATSSSTTVKSPTPATEPVGVDTAALDRSVSPCNDFYQFACGGWIKATPIPQDESRWFRSFSVIHKQNETTLRNILEAYARGENASDPYAKELGDFYGACMDEKAIEEAGTTPLKKLLDQTAKFSKSSTFAPMLANLHGVGVNALFGYGSGQDFKDATQVIGVIGQGGLGLPDRDYYFPKTDKAKHILAEYEAYIARTFELLGGAKAEATEKARSVIKFETTLAEASMNKVDRRDPDKTYHRMTKADLTQLSPEIAWDAYFAARETPGVAAINVEQPEFIKAVGKQLSAANETEWRNYLQWHVASSFAGALPERFVQNAFQFQKALTGAKELPARWKRCVRATDGAMGEALARPFVKTTLGAEGKASVLAMVHQIEHAMGENLDQLAWMDAPTRLLAKEKLASIANKIAYPDKWRSYDGLHIMRTSYLGNAFHAALFEEARQLAKIGKPVDRSEWEMTPPTVNAYYEPTLNEMVFPAGILQPPFYSTRAPGAVNYGAIGMVMGHELTHGFDDEGRKFDANGNLRDWWTPVAGDEFDRRAACVANQFDQYTVAGDAHVNGKLTLGENIADLGGMKLALMALRSDIASGRVQSVGGEFSDDQQMFLGFAQGWCGSVREEYARMLVAVDPHAPAKYRVNGPLSNTPEFSKAFACKEGDQMVRPAEVRCEIW